MNTQIWLAELLRAQDELSPDDDTLRVISDLLGLCTLVAPAAFRSTEKQPLQVVENQPELRDQRQAERLDTKEPIQPFDKSQEWTRLLSKLEPTKQSTTSDDSPWWNDSAPIFVSITPPPEPQRPLLGRLQRRALLSIALSVDVNEGPVDIDRIVRTFSEGRPLRALPYLKRRTLRYGLEVLVDRAPWLEPFFLEQTQILAYLKALLPTDRLRVQRCLGGPQEHKTQLSRLRQGPRMVIHPRAPVLALSDLGLGFRYLSVPPPAVDVWADYAQKLTQRGRTLLALVPYERDRWHSPVGATVRALPWSDRTTVQDAVHLRRGGAFYDRHDHHSHRARYDDDIVALARVLSPAMRIDPWLLREARLTLMPQLNVGVEADLWFSDMIESRSVEGLVLDIGIQRRLREELRDQSELLNPALALVKQAHRAFPDTIRLEESLIRLELEDQLDEAAVKRLLAPALKTVTGGGRSADEIAYWANHAWRRFSPKVHQTKAARQLIYASILKVRGSPPDDLLIPKDSSWLLPSADQRPLFVEWRQYPDGNMEIAFHESASQPSIQQETSLVSSAVHQLSIPDLDPLLIEIEDRRETQSPELIRLTRGLASRHPIDNRTRSLMLRTTGGDSFRFDVCRSLREGVVASLLQVSPKLPAAMRTGILISTSLVVTASSGLSQGDIIQLKRANSSSTRAARVLGDFRVASNSDGVDTACLLKLMPPPSDQVDTVLWLPIDTSATLFTEPAGQGNDTDGMVLHVNGKGMVTQTNLNDTQGVFLDEGFLGSVVYETESVWALVIHVNGATGGDSKSQLIGLPEESFVTAPFLRVVDEAHAFAQSRLIFHLLAIEEHQHKAARLNTALVKNLGTWRVSEHAAEADVLIWIGNAFNSAIVESLTSAKAANKPLLWIPLSPDPQAELSHLPLPLQTTMRHAQWFGLSEKLPLSNRGVNRIAKEIAAWQPTSSENHLDLLKSASVGIFNLAGTSIRHLLVDKLERNTHANGLYQVPLDRPFMPQSFTLQSDGNPILVLIHGEASSGESSFGDLWSDVATKDREALMNRYFNQVLTYEYFSIKEDPFHSALRLLELLPSGTRLHLLTLGAGGLIGELLTRSHRTDDAAPFDAIDEQIVRNSIASDRLDTLRKLSGLLQEKRIALERFVRVACPARGTRLFSEGPEKAASLLTLFPGMGIAGMMSKSIVRLFTDPRTTPGLAMLAPESPLIRLLNRRDVKVTAPLAVIAGIAQEKSISARIARHYVNALMIDDPEHDLVVTVDSALGGVNRLDVAGQMIDRGESTNHFSYFRNANTRQAIVNALLSISNPPPGFQNLQV